MPAYPSMDQYNEAVQHPRTAFTDPALKNGTVKSDTFGIPIALGGGFALTYTVTSSSRTFAVRCFHKQVDDLESRYAKISQALSRDSAPYFVDFQYKPSGILVNGKRFPIVRMDWVQGETLGAYLERHYKNKAQMMRLRNHFVELESFLLRKGIAHGDLQNGNALVNGSFKLIDYDGMYVPGLPHGRGNELGHKHFQHPRRQASDFGPEMDRFSFILIDLSLRALIEKPELFDKHSNGDNIIFAAGDLADPRSSSIFADLRSVQSLAGDTDNFAQICASPIGNVPTLQDFLAGRNIPGKVISFSRPAAAIPRGPAAYIGAYDVLDATDFDRVVARVGDRVELVGRISDVYFGLTRKRHDPYVFLNFNNWRGRNIKINIWSDGLAKLLKRPDDSWKGQWISVTGLVDPPYMKGRRYPSVSITLNEPNQLRFIDEAEALRRLAGSKVRGPASTTSAGTTSNENILKGITRSAATRPQGRSKSAPRANPPSSASHRQSPAAAPLTAQSPNQQILSGLRTKSPTQQVETPPAASPVKLPPQRKQGVLKWVWLLILALLLFLWFVFGAR